MEYLGVEDWDHLFRECRRSAFHMEVRDTYGVPKESEPLRRFLNGEPPPVYDKSGWIAIIRDVIGRGAVMSRIRVITVPHSDYQRWLLSVTHVNVEAGEDIRYLPRHLVEPDRVPSDDWWLFDDEKVAFNLVDGDGKTAGVAVTTDPKIADYCREVRERLWQLAIPYREYFDETPVNSR